MNLLFSRQTVDQHECAYLSIKDRTIARAAIALGLLGPLLIGGPSSHREERQELALSVELFAVAMRHMSTDAVPIHPRTLKGKKSIMNKIDAKPEAAGWPDALVKATQDEFEYMAKLRSGEIVVFEGAST